MTNVGHISEVHVERFFSADEIAIDIDEKDRFVIPILEEGWEQPDDGHELTRRSRKGRGCSDALAKVEDGDEDETNRSHSTEQGIRRKAKRKEKKLSAKDRK